MEESRRATILWDIGRKAPEDPEQNQLCGLEGPSKGLDSIQQAIHSRPYIVMRDCKWKANT